MSGSNMWQDFLDQKINDRDTKLIEKFFLGKNVVVTYANNRPYIITGIDFAQSPESPFPDPTVGTYIDYFKNKYNQHIKYKNQFMVTAVSKDPIRINDRTK